MKVLIAEDEVKVQRFIKLALKEAGMVVDAVGRVPDLLSALQTGSYEILILDRLIRGKDALLLLKDIRKKYPQMKVLVLSALSAAEEKVAGLKEGADDYLGKPFHVPELIERVRAISRRSASKEGTPTPNVIQYKDLKMDLEKQQVFRNQQKMDLTGKEFRLLHLLIRNPGRIFSKSSLLDQVWEMNHYPESNVVEVTVANLRAKIDRGYAPLIFSRRGVGYWVGDIED
jgi:DNA-binding response OmpR family regulator